MIIHDDFAFFGLDINASLNDIKEKYRQLAFGAHPDQGGDVAQFSKLNEHYRNCIEFARNVPCELCKGTGRFTTVSAAMKLITIPCVQCEGTGRRNR